MAVLKHIASKNAHYGDAIDYLKYEYDELRMKPVLDRNGNMKLRSEFILDGINCNPETFDVECEMLNASFHKNQSYGDIKTHHYIISFDPRDQADHGLTGEKAQAIGLEYAKKNFPGHQALVCVHMDGHNKSGNIHVHIVINSLRKYDVERQDFMERPCDSRAGYKHHLTRDYLKHLKRSLMEICQRENLYQVDLLSPAESRKTEREYWSERRGQEKLDKLNEKIIEDGLTPMKTKFQTQKQFLRDAIDDAASSATSPEMFRTILLERYGIKLTESRGRYSYLHPERNKNITGRALGTRYEKESLLARFMENEKAARMEKTDSMSADEKRNADNSESVQDAGKTKNDSAPDEEERHSTIFDSGYDYESDPIAILYIRSELRLVVDLQNCTKAKLNQAYAQKVKISNLKEMAKTIAYVQEHGYESRDRLQDSYDDITQKMKDSRKALRSTEEQIRSVNQQIHFTGQYLANKSVYGQMLKSRNKKKFRQEHSDEITLYEDARKFLKEKYPDGKFPSMKSLKEEREKLSARQKAQHEAYTNFKNARKDLQTICSNIDSILGQGRTLKPEQEHTIS